MTKGAAEGSSSSRGIFTFEQAQSQARSSVLKRLVAKIFGFDSEIQELRRQVRDLSWDTSFGMWTRPAFLQFCHVMPRDMRWVIFIDVNSIHEPNEELGYAEVNRRIKENLFGSVAEQRCGCPLVFGRRDRHSSRLG